VDQGFVLDRKWIWRKCTNISSFGAGEGRIWIGCDENPAALRISAGTTGGQIDFILLLDING